MRRADENDSDPAARLFDAEADAALASEDEVDAVFAAVLSDRCAKQRHAERSSSALVERATDERCAEIVPLFPHRGRPTMEARRRPSRLGSLAPILVAGAFSALAVLLVLPSQTTTAQRLEGLGFEPCLVAIKELQLRHSSGAASGIPQTAVPDSSASETVEPELGKSKDNPGTSPPRAAKRASVEAVWEEGRRAYESRDRERAADLFRAALELDPRHAPTLNSLGRIAAEQRDPERARGLFLRAVEADPGYAYPLVNLATQALLDRRLEEAERFLERALELAPEQADALLLRRKLSRVQRSLQAPPGTR